MMRTFRPWRWHRSIQRWLNMPKRAARTVSPGESVFDTAASHPPVPVDGFADRKQLAAYCERVIRTAHPHVGAE